MLQSKTTSPSLFRRSTTWLDTQNQLRPLWKALLFLISFTACFFLVRPLMPLVPHAYKNIAQSMLFSFTGIGLTWYLLKKEGSSLATAGLNLNAKWFGQAFVGILPGIPVTLLIVLTEGIVFDTTLALNKNFQLPAYISLFHAILWSSLFQEVVFRGYIFQSMIKQWGTWKAQVGMAVIFSLYHITMGPLIMVTTFFFSFLFGLAYIRTKSLALPIGLHAGFYLATVSFGTEGSPAQLFVRAIPDSSESLTSGFVILLPTLIITILCCVALYAYKRNPSVKGQMERVK